LQVAGFESSLKAGVLKERVCFFAAEPVVGQELNVRNSRFSDLVFAFDETEDSASGDKDQAVDKDGHFSSFSREFLEDSGLHNLRFVLLSDLETAHKGGVTVKPSHVSSLVLVQKLVDVRDVVSCRRVLGVHSREQVDVAGDHLSNVLGLDSDIEHLGHSVVFAAVTVVIV